MLSKSEKEQKVREFLTFVRSYLSPYDILWLIKQLNLIHSDKSGDDKKDNQEIIHG